MNNCIWSCGFHGWDVFIKEFMPDTLPLGIYQIQFRGRGIIKTLEWFFFDTIYWLCIVSQIIKFVLRWKAMLKLIGTTLVFLFQNLAWDIFTSCLLFWYCYFDILLSCAISALPFYFLVIISNNYLIFFS